MEIQTRIRPGTWLGYGQVDTRASECKLSEPVCGCVCARACVRAYVPACVCARACVCLCVCARVCARAHCRTTSSPSSASASRPPTASGKGVIIVLCVCVCVCVCVYVYVRARGRAYACASVRACCSRIMISVQTNIDGHDIKNRFIISKIGLSKKNHFWFDIPVCRIFLTLGVRTRICSVLRPG